MGQIQGAGWVSFPLPMTAQLITDIRPVEIDGVHWVSMNKDGREVERRGPFPSAAAAEAKAEHLIQADLNKRWTDALPHG